MAPGAHPTTVRTERKVSSVSSWGAISSTISLGLTYCPSFSDPGVLASQNRRSCAMHAQVLYYARQRCNSVPPTTWRTAVAARRTSSAAVSASSWFKAKCSTTGVSPGATPTCGRCSCAASVDSRPGSVDRRPTGAVVDTMRPLRSELCAANTVGACAMASATSASRAHPRVVPAEMWRFISHNLMHKAACSQTLTQRSGLTHVVRAARKEWTA